MIRFKRLRQELRVLIPPKRPGPQLLTSRVAEKAGFGTVAKWMGYPDIAPYLYYFTLIWIVNFGGLSMIQYILRGYHPAKAIPFWWLPPVGAMIGILGADWFTRKYDNLVFSSFLQVDDKEPLRRPLTPFIIQIGIYVLFAIGIVSFWLIHPGVLDSILGLGGNIAIIKLIVVYFGVYILIVSEVVSVLFGIYFVLPWRLIQAEVELNFIDPTGAGGLQLIGKLIQQSTIFYFIGLFIYTIVAFAPRIFPSWPGPDVVEFFSGIFVAAWLFGVVLFFIPNIWLHGEMKRQKEARIELIQNKLAVVGRHSKQFPYMAADDEIPRYLYWHLALKRASHTREYPVAPRLMRSIFISMTLSLILPFGVSVLPSIIGI